MSGCATRFALSSHQLAYFSSDKAERARRVVDLRAFTIKHSARDSDKTHPFTMVLAETNGVFAKSYLIAAETEVEEKAWIGSIQAVINQLNLRE
jgi:hypothetical protein